MGVTSRRGRNKQTKREVMDGEDNDDDGEDDDDIHTDGRRARRLLIGL